MKDKLELHITNIAKNKIYYAGEFENFYNRNIAVQFRDFTKVPTPGFVSACHNGMTVDYNEDVVIVITKDTILKEYYTVWIYSTEAQIPEIGESVSSGDEVVSIHRPENAMNREIFYKEKERKLNEKYGVKVS